MEQNLRFAATYRDDMWITIQLMEQEFTMKIAI